MKKSIRTTCKEVIAITLIGVLSVAYIPANMTKPIRAYATDISTREAIEDSLYNAEYYAKANEDVAVALNNDPEALYQHWLAYGKKEGRNASMVFNAKYYLEVNRDVASIVGENNYEGAYEHFVTSGLLEGRESSPVFSVTYYLYANKDVANAFNNDYIMAAQHFNLSAITEGRSGSGNFDYTVYRDCNKDVEALYGNYVQGYYIHYINHGRAEGRTAGLGTNTSGSTEGTTNIDVSTPSYRIFDATYYLDKFPSLATEVGTDTDALYKYWITEGISKGQTASPVIVPEEYLELNQDVAEVFGNDYAAAINHFLTAGITEGRTGSKEFDYSIYKACNTDVGEVFANDIVGYYFHYVKYGRAENRTAAVHVPQNEAAVQAYKELVSILDAISQNKKVTLYYDNDSTKAYLGSVWDDLGPGSQCFSFAHTLWYNLYGYKLATAYYSSARYKLYNFSNQAELVYQKAKPSQTEINSLENILKRGDFIQFSYYKSSGAVSQHSMIVNKVSSTGIEIIDANWDNKNGVTLHTLTWSGDMPYRTSIGISVYRDKYMIEVLEALGDEGIDNEEPASTLVLYAEKKAGILDLSSKGWSSYNVGLDKDMYADKAYTIYNGAKLDVLGEDTNVNGNKVYYVYSPDLNMKCYITAKYVNVTQ